MTTHSNHFVILFTWGVFIGFCLEILLFERDQSTGFGPHNSSLEGSGVGVTCLILLKNKEVDFLRSSKATWLRHCTNHFVVDLQRCHKSNGNHLETSKAAFYDDRRSPKDKSCPSPDSEVIRIRGKSAWSGFCKALHVTSSVNNQWLIIVSDSVMVLVENLKLFTRGLDPSQAHYYGYGIKHYQADFNSLSAGILLSRGSLNLLLRKFKTDEDCDDHGRYWRNEDVYLGKFLKEFGVVPKDTRDEDGRGRFHGYNIYSLLQPRKLVLQSDYMKKALFPVPQGFNCCSPHLITLEASSPDAMYKLYFFLYNVKTSHKGLPPLVRPSMGEGFFWKDFLRERGLTEAAIENMTSEEYYKIWEKIIPPEVMYDQMRNFVIHKEEEN